MSKLTLTNALAVLKRTARNMPRQIADPSAGDLGAVVYPDYGIADNKAKSAFVTMCGCC